ncbi:MULTISPECIES: hypothetical protein [Paenibacillus]|uniref:hypothetical protein n=1 Tax=Paenibacillus TaxID=44249 RepID=UPI0009558E91|nr:MULTISPECIES: hypothetical protein [Paenibacillus]ASS67098.1 hypothetical protein CIC07_13840 [Paenibacillus sp. RUD330]SIQ90248.1 hypothetical protein SAMN05880555_2666 [Paenibacillus sp. RU4X]SIR11098.1 hypothetical protein SAMN05880570_2666 [Paenibacillus sp. RU4T]
MTEAHEQAGAAAAQDQEAAEQPKKMTLAEAAKLKLQQKKQAQAVGKQGQAGGAQGGAKELRSQLNKKPNNQRRRMGV